MTRATTLTAAEARKLGLLPAEATSKLPRRKNSTDETAIVAACLKLLELRGVMAWRTNNVGIFDPVRKVFRTFSGRKGVSDILGILAPSGRSLAVECKRPGGKLTPDQKRFLDDVRGSGGLALCVSDVAALDAALRLEKV